MADSGLAGLIAVGEEAAPLLDGARRVPSWTGEALAVPDGEAAPMLAGARRVRSWTGDALAVPDGAAAVDALANQVKPGDVVWVKASRAARLEGVAADLLREADR